MDPSTVRRLADLNQDFYEEFAAEFSASRQRLNPGIEEVLAAFAARAANDLLDLGCGDGRVGRAWLAPAAAEGTTRRTYLGVDRSAALLTVRPATDGLRFVALDLSETGWVERLRPLAATPREAHEPPAPTFDAVVCFAALHHVPGRTRRVELLRGIRSLLAPGGCWAVSVWQFLHLERFRRRVLDWSEVGLAPGRLERGDVLLDWRRGGRALRYVHHYDESTLREDCGLAGLEVERAWRSDGQTHDMGLYLMGS